MLSQIKYFLGALFEPRVTPPITANTFFVWEPCTYSHAEVVPGYVKYLLDLGFDVTVFVTPKRLEEGLLSRFGDTRVTTNTMSQAAIMRYFKENGLSNAKGILITTARKIGKRDSYETELSLFATRSPEQKVLLVEHDVRKTADNGAIKPSIITIRKVFYGDTTTTVVNPHYFGAVKITAKSTNTVNFITIGAMRARRRNTNALIDAAAELHRKGVSNFKITVIGRGSLRRVPAHLRGHFDIKGRVEFAQLYTELEKADFFLTLLDPDNPLHERYLTTGTSGNFQLIYGFIKPCLIADKFAKANGFNAENSIVYTHNSGLAASMMAAVNLTQGEYGSMQASLTELARSVYEESLRNLQGLATDENPRP